MALILRIVQGASSNDNTGKKAPEPVALLNASTCAASGGTWEDCGSPCHELKPGEACIQVCEEQCQCVNDTQCPFGYACVDGEGLCKVTSSSSL